MNELILLKSGEIALKGLNRSSFEDALIRNSRRRLEDLGRFKFYKAQSAIYAEPMEECDLDEALERLSKVFGFSALSRAKIVDKDFEKIKTAAVEYLRSDLEAARTFKVTCKRSDKKFKPASPELCAELGGFILDEFAHLTVDLHKPDVTVAVEIRDFAAYIHHGQITGAGGMPVGTSGNAALLISGGIDSPVAGYMMAKRGLKVIAVHFASPPYTSERAEQKVHELCAEISAYCGRIRLFTVPFTEIQEQIKDKCPEEYFTLIMRRFMMKIAERIAEQNDCGALITGESVAQVASQTLLSLACTDAAVTMPVLRPVIGMDKEEIIAVSRRIGTFETSILPYDDCCTVFTPKHPKTKPRLDDVQKAEEPLDSQGLIERALEGVRVATICG